MIRSLGGWSEVKKLLLKGMDRLKGDERILGDTDFVQSMLATGELGLFESMSRSRQHGDSIRINNSGICSHQRKIVHNGSGSQKSIGGVLMGKVDQSALNGHFLIEGRLS